MGLFFRKTKPASDLQQSGIRCRATVEHCDLMGRGSARFSLSNRKAESILAGAESPIRQKVRMRVEPEVGDPYVVTTKVSVPLMKAGWLRAGSTVQVLVDPDDRERVAIDWEGPHEEGSMAALFADDPLARAALEGAGLDPDSIARQADAARRGASGS